MTRAVLTKTFYRGIGLEAADKLIKEPVMKNIRFALRSLTKTPVVTLAVVLSLGIGIGANTAIFSLLHQIILSELPVEKPEQLVVLTSPGDVKSGHISADDSGGPDYIFSYPAFRRLEHDPKGVASVAAFRMLGANIAYRNETVNGSAMVVSGGYFSTFGVKPLYGRLIRREDDRHGAPNPVAVLGYGFWKDHLGAQVDALNQPVRVNGQIFTIVGIAPKNFRGTTPGQTAQIFLPLAAKPRLTPGRDGTDRYDDYWLYLFARLRPEVGIALAQNALNTVYAGIVDEQAKTIQGRNQAYVARFQKSRITLKDGSHGNSTLRDDSRAPLTVLMCATALVLLIAMANAANLLLARAAQRGKELAIRTALGAGRRTIMRELLTEAVALSAAGGIAGILLGAWTLSLLISLLGGEDASNVFLSTSLSWPVLLFSIAVSLASGLMFGLYPAWSASRNTLSGVLKETGANVSAAQGAARVRKILVCAQVALSVLLLIPTGLFLESLQNLLRVNLGIRTENVITFRISPELNGYKPAENRALFERVEAQLSALPGVRSVTESRIGLVSGDDWSNNVTVEGYSRDPEADTGSMVNAVGPAFFSRMGIPLIAGREFTEADTTTGPKVAVVNEEFAKHFFGDRNPIGRKFTRGSGKGALDIEIVGVASNSRYSNVKEKSRRVYFLPWRQLDESGSLSFYVRTTSPAMQLVPQIRKVISTVDRNLPVESVRTLDQQIAMNIHSDRIVLQVGAVFAAVATILAMLGLYGVMAYSVTRRTREIGIRLALGAGNDRIRRLILGELTAILIVGIAIGVPAAIGAGRLSASLLYGVKAFDPLVITGALVALSIAAFAAGYIPIRRATRISALEALRYE
jgi:predicted permease